MIDPTADKLALLLSTDWFAHHWPAIGVYVNSSAKERIQKAVRAEILRAFSAKEYWRASFAPERIAATKSVVQKAFSGLTAASRIDELLGQPNPSESESALPATLTELLISEPSMVSLSLAQLVSQVWTRAGIVDVNWVGLCEAATSDWDRLVKNLSPDTPCWLAHVVAVEFVNYERFGFFWSEFCSLATDVQRLELISWYRSAALELAGRAIELDALN